MSRLETNTRPLDVQIRVLDRVLDNFRIGARAGNEIAKENYEVLKSVAAALQARKYVSKNDALVEIEAALDAVQRSKCALGYDEGRMVHLAGIIIRRWPTIAQSLEQFKQQEEA